MTFGRIDCPSLSAGNEALHEDRLSSRTHKESEGGGGEEDSTKTLTATCPISAHTRYVLAGRVDGGWTGNPEAKLISCVVDGHG